MTDKIPDALAVLDEAIHALEFLPGADGIAAKDKLIKARAALAELISADKEWDAAWHGWRSGTRVINAAIRRTKALAAVETLTP